MRGAHGTYFFQDTCHKIRRNSRMFELFIFLTTRTKVRADAVTLQRKSLVKQRAYKAGKVEGKSRWETFPDSHQ